MNEFDLLWADLNTRLEIVPGKELFSMVNDRLQHEHGVHISHMKVIDAFKRPEVPSELVDLLETLEKFRKIDPPA